MSRSWITARDALARLGTKPQTLYANVSRGRVRAKPDPADSRRSLYSAADVERLAARGTGRRSSEAVAAAAIRWGDPVLSSAITAIAGGRLLYRGQDAVALAETAGLEEVAALLWQADRRTWPPTAASGATGGREDPRAAGFALQRAYHLLAGRAATDLPSHGRSTAALQREAAALAADLAAALAGTGEPTDRPLHESLARAWKRPAAADLIRRALVLLADHELNASTFAARVAVSTGASLAAALLAGLATLSGPLHGGASAAVRSLAAAAERLGPEAAVRAWLAEGRSLPAFGHRLYPLGDSRAAALLARFDPPPLFRDLREVAEAVTGDPANIDFALAAMTATFELPPDAPLRLFALARSVGWLAHALEQHEAGELIRPRAHYTGPPVAG